MQLHLGLARPAGRQELLRHLGRERPHRRRRCASAVRERRRRRSVSRVRITPQQDLLLTRRARSRRAARRSSTPHGVARPEAVSLRAPQRDGVPGEAHLRPRDDRRRERILPRWIDAIEAAGLGDVDVVIRMTGCPNNCARPPSAEIGIFGYGKNDHVMLVGRLARRHAPRARALRARRRGADGAGAGGPVARDPRRATRTAAGRRVPAPPPPEQLRAWVGVATPPRTRPDGAVYCTSAPARRGSIAPEDPLEPALPRCAALASRGRARSRRRVDAGGSSARPAERLGAQPSPTRACSRPCWRPPAESKRRGRASWSASRATSSSRSPTCVATAATYCTFAKRPDSPTRRPTRSTRSPRSRAAASRAGCIEALFCLGDKPEIAYRALPRVARRAGPPQTAEYLVEACRVAVEGGHAARTPTPACSRRRRWRELERWNASMGLMLETTSPRLRGRAARTTAAPDKEPAVRLRMHEEAGELASRSRPACCWGSARRRRARRHAARDPRAPDRLRPHPGSHHPAVPPQARHAMRERRSPEDDDEVRLGRAGASGARARDERAGAAEPRAASAARAAAARGRWTTWGGVSPVTVDFINPEAPWPTLRALAQPHRGGRPALRRAPARLSRALLGRPELFEPRVRERALALAGADWVRKARPRRSVEAA